MEATPQYQATTPAESTAQGSVSTHCRERWTCLRKCATEPIYPSGIQLYALTLEEILVELDGLWLGADVEFLLHGLLADMVPANSSATLT